MTLHGSRLAAPLRPGHRLLCFVIAWVPALVLLYAAGGVVVTRLNELLAQARPLAESEASRSLGREVRIGRLSPDLTLGRVLEMALHRDRLGTLPVTVQDLAIANGRTLKGSGAMARAARGTAWISLPRLLAGDVSNAIPRILVESPDLLLIRRANGRLNVLDLVQPPKGPPGKPFQTTVVLQQGRVTFRDFGARLPAGSLPAVNYLSGVNGSVDLSGTRTVRFDATAHAAPGTATAARLGGPLTVSGSAARDAKQPGAISLLSLRVRDADVPYWLDYLSGVRGVAVVTGRADADLSLAIPRPARAGAPLQPQFSGTAWLRRGHIALRQLPAPLEAVGAVARFNMDTVRVDATGRFLGQDLSASGTLWDFLIPNGAAAKPVSPQIALSLSMPRVPLSQAVATLLPHGTHLPAGVTLGGMGSLAGLVQGPVRNPVVTAQIHIPTAAYRGNAVNDLAARLVYAQGVLTATDLTGRVAGGRLTGRAAGQIATMTPDGVTHFLPASALRAAFAAGISGADLSRIQAAVAGAGKGGSLLNGRTDLQAVGKFVGGKLTAAANVIASGTSFRGIQVSKLTARVLITDNQIVLPALVASTSAGAARIAGHVAPDGRLALTVTGVGLDLARIGHAFGRSDLQGVAYLSGKIGGMARDPVLTASDVRVLGPGYRTFRADIVTGSLTATRSRIALGKNVVVRRFPASVAVSGDITELTTPAPHLNLVAQGQNAELTDILRQAGLKTENLPRINGVLEQATVRVAGTTTDPRVTGSIRLGSTLVGDFAFQGGALDFALSHGAVTVTRAEVDGKDLGTLTASGGVDTAGRLSGTFALENAKLASLAAITHQYARLEGNVTVRGTVSGTRTDPVVHADLSSSGVRVADTPFTNVAATVTLAANTATGDARITVPLATFSQNGADIRITNTVYDKLSGRLSSSLTLQNGDLRVVVDTLQRSNIRDTAGGARLLVALNNLPQPISGKFSIPSLQVRGRFTPKGVTEPYVSAHLAASDIGLGEVHADTFVARATLAGNTVTVNEFTLTNQATDTRILIEPGSTADLSSTGTMHVVLDSNNIPLALVRAFVPVAQRATLPAMAGPVDLTVSADGRTRTPTVRASLEGSALRIGGVTLDRVRVPQLVLGPAAGGGDLGLIKLSEILLLRNGHEIRITGRADTPDVTATLPFSYSHFSPPPDAPISLHAEANEQGLDLIAGFVPALAKVPLSGTFSTLLDVAGTLEDPKLSGYLRVAHGKFALPHTPELKRDRANPISDLNVDLRFDGRMIHFDQFALTLGGPNGQKGDFGHMTVAGDIDIGNLQKLALDTITLNLTASLNDLHPILNNLMPGNVGDAWGARINGTLFVTGPLRRPLIATKTPLVLKEAYLQTPEREAPPPPVTATPVTSDTTQAAGPSPRFNIVLAVDKKATVRSAKSVTSEFSVDAVGTGTILGSLRRPNIAADLDVLGGYFRLPTARFVIKRGGEIRFAFHNVGGGARDADNEVNVSVSDLVAKATVYAPSGVTPSLGIRENQGVFSSAAPLSTSHSTPYHITAEINGSLLDPGGMKLNPTSDPPLNQSQILALIGSQQQIEQAAGGGVQNALTGVFAGFAKNAFLPSLISPLEQSLTSVLGLEEFSVDYNPDAPVTLNLVKRFPDPFRRFLISYTRTLGGGQRTTGTGPSTEAPYELSGYYELPVRLRVGVFNNFQIGASTNEQHVNTYFLRGSFSF